MKFLMLAALAAAICLPGMAFATTISYTNAISGDGGGGDWDFNFQISGGKRWYKPSFIGYGDPADNPPYTINLTQFNPSLGTLNKVTLSLTREIDASVFYQATSYPTSIQYYLEDRASWVMSSTTWGDSAFSFTNYPVATAITDTNRHTVPKEQTDALLKEFTGDFAAFIGTGVFSTALYDATATGIVSGGNGSYGTTFHFTSDATVTYDYNPAPIASTLLLMGSGLLGIGGLGWRRKRRVKAP